MNTNSAYLSLPQLIRVPKLPWVFEAGVELEKDIRDDVTAAANKLSAAIHAKLRDTGETMSWPLFVVDAPFIGDWQRDKDSFLDSIDDMASGFLRRARSSYKPSNGRRAGAEEKRKRGTEPTARAQYVPSHVKQQYHDALQRARGRRTANNHG